MTIFIGAIDGLDYRLVEEQGLLGGLGVKELQQDLSGANALFTYRVWPSIWAGVNGGRSAEPYGRFYPDAATFWEKYPAAVVNLPHTEGRICQYQDTFPEDGRREAAGPKERVVETQEMLETAVDNALSRDEIEIVAAGTKQPDISGHLDPNEGRCIDKIRLVCEKFREFATDERVSDYLIVSDHGFVDEYGDRPSGIEAHTTHATLASSFADYDKMSNFIENWHSDLADAYREVELAALGYK